MGGLLTSLSVLWTVVAIVGGMCIGALVIRRLDQRQGLPAKMRWQPTVYGAGIISGGLLGLFSISITQAIVEGQGLGLANSPLVYLGVLIGMWVGALVVRRKTRRLPPDKRWQLVAYGGGIYLGGVLGLFMAVLVLLLPGSLRP